MVEKLTGPVINEKLHEAHGWALVEAERDAIRKIYTEAQEDVDSCRQDEDLEG